MTDGGKQKKKVNYIAGGIMMMVIAVVFIGMSSSGDSGAFCCLSMIFFITGFIVLLIGTGAIDLKKFKKNWLESANPDPEKEDNKQTSADKRPKKKSPSTSIKYQQINDDHDMDEEDIVLKPRLAPPPPGSK